MTDQEALIATIVNNPDDDMARLVYADWLDERAKRGNAFKQQAYLIRWQYDPSFKKPTDRAICFALRRQIGFKEAVFSRILPYYVTVKNQIEFLVETNFCGYVAVNRGFITRIIAMPRVLTWLTYGPHIVRHVPLESVWFTDNQRPSYCSLSRKFYWPNTSHMSFSRAGVSAVNVPWLSGDIVYHEREANACDWYSAQAIAWAKSLTKKEKQNDGTRTVTSDNY